MCPQTLDHTHRCGQTNINAPRRYPLHRIRSRGERARIYLNEDLAVHTSSEPASPLRTVGGAETVRLAVVVGALGVVFGDIGTSPIYTIQTVFNPSDPHPVPISTDNVYGIVSLRLKVHVAAGRRRPPQPAQMPLTLPGPESAHRTGGLERFGER